MLGYKIYFLNDDGHIARATDHFAETDSEAIEDAERLALGAAFELWEGARCILPWPATERFAAASS